MLEAMSGGLGLGIIVSAVLLAVVLEVGDERAAGRLPAHGAADAGRRWEVIARPVLRTLLGVLVPASLAVVIVRIFLVVG